MLTSEMTPPRLRQVRMQTGDEECSTVTWRKVMFRMPPLVLLPMVRPWARAQVTFSMSMFSAGMQSSPGPLCQTPLCLCSATRTPLLIATQSSPVLT